MIDWKTCNFCQEEYVYEHVRCAEGYLGPASVSPQRLLQLQEYLGQLTRLRNKVAENITDNSYGPVSYGELRLLFYLMDEAIAKHGNVY